MKMRMVSQRPSTVRCQMESVRDDEAALFSDSGVAIW
jgi:hypothetical protein